MERRLRVLAEWLKMETDTTKSEIGDLLLEVLDLSDDGVTENLEDTDYTKEQERIVNLRK
jgi:hypothetical protein